MPWFPLAYPMFFSFPLRYYKNLRMRGGVTRRWEAGGLKIWVRILQVTKKVYLFFYTVLKICLHNSIIRIVVDKISILTAFSDGSVSKLSESAEKWAGSKSLLKTDMWTYICLFYSISSTVDFNPSHILSICTYTFMYNVYIYIAPKIVYDTFKISIKNQKQT